MIDINGAWPLLLRNRLQDGRSALKRYGYDESKLDSSYCALSEGLNHKIEALSTKDGHGVFSISILEGVSEDGEKEALTISKKAATDLTIVGEEIYRNQIMHAVQSMLMELLLITPQKELNVTMVDFKSAGASFGQLINVAQSDQLRFGGQVYIKSKDIEDRITELQQLAGKNVVAMGGKYTSVFEHNLVEDYQIPITYLILFDYGDDLQGSIKSKLSDLEQIAENGGISIIRIRIGEGAAAFAVGLEDGRIGLEFTKDGALLHVCDFTQKCRINDNGFTQEDIERVCEKQKISNNAEDFFHLDNLSYDFGEARSGIRVPFAVNEKGEVIDFCIATCSYDNFAFVSGTTGCGKSTLLHTIIHSIILNYTPDQIELWAVDFKRVEFNTYVGKRPPHMRIVAQDISDDFCYSLLDEMTAELRRRQSLFNQVNVEKIGDYRRQTGRVLPRILIIIDEFHVFSQAISKFQEKKIQFENILAEGRALGISMLLSDQFYTAGLSGLTDKAREQIGVRLCMRQTSAPEIRGVLNESIEFLSSYEKIISNYGTGQFFYKQPQGDGSSKYHNSRAIYFPDTKGEDGRSYRDKVQERVEEVIGDNFEKKHVIIIKDSNRYSVLEKELHSLNQFIKGYPIELNEEGITILPAGPSTLEEEIRMNLDRNPGSNVLLCCADRDMRNSTVLFSVMSLLMNPDNEVNLSMIDSMSTDAKALLEVLKKLKSDQLHIYKDGDALDHILTQYKKVKPVMAGNRVELIFGLDKLNSLVYLLNDDEDDEEDEVVTPVREEKATTVFSGIEKPSAGADASDLLAFFSAASAASEQYAKESASGGSFSSISRENDRTVKSSSEKKVYDEQQILNTITTLLQYGPGFGNFVILLVNSAKQLRTAGIKNLTNIEHRIAGVISTEDSHTIFESGTLGEKANSETLVYYSGTVSGAKTIRPYLMPDDDYIESFNNRL